MGVTQDRTGVWIREAAPDDLGFLWDMLYEAAAWRREEPRPSRKETFSNPEISHYLDGWGRQGDLGLVALDRPNGRRMGGAWYRLFPLEDPGYGYVDATTPEVAVAVAWGYRGRGVGRALLNSLAGAARSRGYSALSLGVEQENPAAVLYGSLGYQKASDRDNAWTMRLDLGTEGLGRSGKGAGPA